ncbi:MAG: VanW family protein [Eubacterium sp.]|nr:VanW family protein [Eubacterium sp.]
MKLQHKSHIKKCIIGSLAAVGILTAGFAASQAYAQAEQNDKILDNIYIGEVAVGGMSEEEAKLAVDQYVSEIQNTKFTLTVNDKSITATAKQLGVNWENTGVVEEAAMIGKSGSLISRYKDKKDLEHEPKKLEITFGTEESKIKKYLSANAEKVNQKAVDGGLVRENGSFKITGGEEGIAVDVAESAKTIAAYITNDWDTKEASIALSADVVQPRGSKEELSKVKDVLGTFSTNYSSSSAGRAMNVSNGCNRINGALLYPGDEFSVYEAVSPFDAEHGYALAGSYENGTVVETYGGGICQVSTTLYNAVIRAELKINERFAHSMIVNYVQPSMDAAIAGTYKDLKFANNTDAPVYIEGTTGGGIITFTIYGEETRSPNREVIFESEIVSESNPPTQIQGSASHSVGYVSVQQSAHVGKVAKLWKIVKEDGVEKSREEFNNSNYRASPKIIIVGTSTSSDEARAYIQNAIASQNEGSIYAAAQTAASIAARPQQPEPQEPAEEENPDAENPDAEKTDTEKEDSKKENNKKEENKKEENKKEENKKEDTKNDDSKKSDTNKEASDKKKDEEPTKAAEEGSINSKQTAEPPEDQEAVN